MLSTWMIRSSGGVAVNLVGAMSKNATVQELVALCIAVRVTFAGLALAIQGRY